MTENAELDRFNDLVANLAEHHREFFVLVKTKEGRMFWKSSDRTWAIGAATRYLSSTDEADREGERDALHNTDEDEGETL